MTNRLVIHLPDQSIHLVSDSFDKLNTVSAFCKKELGAYHASEDIDDLTVDTLNNEMSDKLHSLLFKLDLH